MKLGNSKNDEQVKLLKDRINELEKQLIEVAESSGNCIIKQLPNGSIELNGEPIDKNAPVEYYNSSKATYGELTMFRIGKEAEQRNTKKLVSAHMEEVDELNKQINTLTIQLTKAQSKNTTYEGEIVKLNTETSNKDNIIKSLKQQLKDNETIFKQEKDGIISQYESVIAGLHEDIKNWQKRCLAINNVQPNGTIKTKYGELN